MRGDRCLSRLCQGLPRHWPANRLRSALCISTAFTSLPSSAEHARVQLQQLRNRIDDEHGCISSHADLQSAQDSEVAAELHLDTGDEPPGWVNWSAACHRPCLVRLAGTDVSGLDGHWQVKEADEKLGKVTLRLPKPDPAAVQQLQTMLQELAASDIETLAQRQLTLKMPVILDAPRCYRFEVQMWRLDPNMERPKTFDKLLKQNGRGCDQEILIDNLLFSNRQRI